MNDLKRITCGLLLTACLVSCGTDKRQAARSCSVVGQRIGEQTLRGIIYGSVGAKAELKACPGVRLPFAFIGAEPNDYRKLEQLAEQRQDVVGFNAMADGYIVADGRGRYALLLITLDKLREDPSVAKGVRAATG